MANAGRVRYPRGDDDCGDAPPTTAARAARTMLPITAKTNCIGARSAKRLVREIAVIETGQREHAQRIQRGRDSERNPETPTQITPRQARCIAMNGIARSQSMRSSPASALRVGCGLDRTVEPACQRVCERGHAPRCCRHRRFRYEVGLVAHPQDSAGGLRLQMEIRGAAASGCSMPAAASGSEFGQTNSVPVNRRTSATSAKAIR